jgi:hypothetical protein
MADRKISDLTALTTPASGDFLPIVDISEAAAASKNKRITIEELMRGVPNGTAAAPGIAFETDPNTGIYSPGADQLAVATNGTGRLFVDASGGVSISSQNGTALPLTIYSSSNAGNVIKFVGRTTNGKNQLQFYSADGTTVQSQITSSDSSLDINNQLNTYTRFFTNNTERLRITAAGLVGIGNSAPSSLLHISGPGGSSTSPIVTATTGTNYIGQKFINTGGSFWIAIDNSIGSSFLTNTAYSRVLWSDGAYPICFSTNSVERVRIDASGRVGIGTTAPGSPLSVQGSDNSVIAHFHGTTGTNARGLQIGLATNVTANHLVDLNAVGTYGTLTFSSNSNEKARIDSSGRLLVGTSTSRVSRIYYPSGNSAITSTEQIEGTGSTGSLLIVNNQAGAIGSSLILGKSRGATTGSITAVASGDQLGTIQFNGIDVTTTGDLESCAGSIACEVDGTPGANDMPGRLKISSAGDVGINTATPSAPLAFGKAVYGDPSDENFYRIKLKDSGGIANDVGIGMPDANSIGFNTVSNGNVIFYNGTDGESARIDSSSSRLLVGTSTSVATATGQGEAQFFGTQGLHVRRGVNSAAGPQIAFGKTRAITDTAGTIVQSGDILGSIQFAGDDGTDLLSIGAQIKAEVDGTPGANDMPGRIVLATTADGAASPTERMRISQNGAVGISNALDDYPLEVSNTYVAASDATARFSDTKTVSSVASSATATLISGVGGAAYMVYVHRTDSTNRSVFGIYLSGTAGDWTSLATGSAGLVATIAINGNDLEITNDDASTKSYLVTAIRMS